MDSDEREEQEEQSGGVIVPRMEKTVRFYGDDIQAAQMVDEQIYVPLRPLATFLGLAFGSQRNRVLRDEVMAESVRQVQMMASDGRRLSMMCIPLEVLPGWLFSIDTNRVKPELREKLKRYRRECYKVLWSAFKSDVMPMRASEQTGMSRAELTLEMINAMQHLAQQQVEIERRLGRVEGKQEVIAGYVRDFIQDTRKRLADSESRLGSLELRLDPKAMITEEQAAEIALAVKNVGQALAGQGERGGYAKVYSEMYRRYRVSSYKNLTQAKYDEVLGWLSRWYEEIGGKGEF